MSTARELCLAAEQAFARRDFETAESTFRHCLELFPGCAPALHGLGLMAFLAGDLADAAEWVRQALDRQPAQSESWLLLAQVELNRGRATEAEHAVGRGLQLRPADSTMWDYRGRVVRQLGRPFAAYSCFFRAAELDPRNRHALANTRKAAEVLGLVDEALRRVRQLIEIEPNNESHLSGHLGLLCADPSATEETLFAAARRWARCVAPAPAPVPTLIRARSATPRIGFYSASFHDHVISRFFLPLLAALPRSRFDSVHLFHDGPVQDDVTMRLGGLAESWTNLHPLSDNAAAGKIAAAKLDILVDLNGHFDLARLKLLSRPLAPVMAHYLGGACTTGLRTMDYRLADAIAEPPGDSDHWSTEKIVRLPRGFHCYAPLHPTDEPAPAPCAARPEVTFGTTAALYKLSPALLRVWAALLERVPDSRLVVVKEIFADAETREDVARRWVAAGIPPGRFELISAEKDAFSRGAVWSDIDIALDPFPYNGVTTTCEALWMGVPVVALRGRRLSARVAASLLTHLGRPEWIADDPERYAEIAAQLASDRAKLAALRAGLRNEFLASPLGQPAIIAADLSDALLAMK